VYVLILSIPSPPPWKVVGNYEGERGSEATISAGKGNLS